jgi:hypothetical protein
VSLDGGSQPAADAIAGHRGADAPADGVGQSRREGINGINGMEDGEREWPATEPSPRSETLERGPVPDSPGQAVSRARPFTRRALITARPARVRIRARKPCVRMRLRFLG